MAEYLTGGNQPSPYDLSMTDPTAYILGTKQLQIAVDANFIIPFDIKAIPTGIIQEVTVAVAKAVAASYREGNVLKDAPKYIDKILFNEGKNVGFSTATKDTARMILTTQSVDKPVQSGVIIQLMREGMFNKKRVPVVNVALRVGVIDPNNIMAMDPNGIPNSATVDKGAQGTPSQPNEVKTPSTPSNSTSPVVKNPETEGSKLPSSGSKVPAGQSQVDSSNTLDAIGDNTTSAIRAVTSFAAQLSRVNLTLEQVRILREMMKISDDKFEQLVQSARMLRGI